MRLIKISIAAMAMFVVAEQSVAANNNRKKEDPREGANERIEPSRVVYKEPEPVVKAVRTLPQSATVVKYKGEHVYFNDGRYYRKDANRYIAVPAPVGVKVQELPLGAKLLRLLDAVYYYCEGTYYAESKNDYVVVDAPQDIIVSSLPEDADQIVIDGKDYYIYDGNVYSIVLTPDGKMFKATGVID